MISARSVVQLYLGPPPTGGCSSAGRAPALQAGGRRFESGHLHQVQEDPKVWRARTGSLSSLTTAYEILEKPERLQRKRVCRDHGGCRGQASKGGRWMPWRQEAKKGVASCEKPRGAASRL